MKGNAAEQLIIKYPTVILTKDRACQFARTFVKNDVVYKLEVVETEENDINLKLSLAQSDDRVKEITLFEKNQYRGKRSHYSRLNQNSSFKESLSVESRESFKLMFEHIFEQSGVDDEYIKMMLGLSIIWAHKHKDGMVLNLAQQILDACEATKMKYPLN